MLLLVNLFVFLALLTVGPSEQANQTCIEIAQAVSVAPEVCEPLQPIQEDDPRWNCAIHGNRECGEATF